MPSLHYTNLEWDRPNLGIKDSNPGKQHIAKRTLVSDDDEVCWYQEPQTHLTDIWWPIDYVLALYTHNLIYATKYSFKKNAKTGSVYFEERLKRYRYEEPVKRLTGVFAITLDKKEASRIDKKDGRTVRYNAIYLVIYHTEGREAIEAWSSETAAIDEELAKWIESLKLYVAECNKQSRRILDYTELQHKAAESRVTSAVPPVVHNAPHTTAISGYAYPAQAVGPHGGYSAVPQTTYGGQTMTMAQMYSGHKK